MLQKLENCTVAYAFTTVLSWHRKQRNFAQVPLIHILRTEVSYFCAQDELTDSRPFLGYYDSSFSVPV